MCAIILGFTEKSIVFWREHFLAPGCPGYDVLDLYKYTRFPECITKKEGK